MELVEYMRARKRMTKCCKIGCDKCPISHTNNGMHIKCKEFEDKYPEKAEKIVEGWAKKHPIETRQGEFLKLFPNAPQSLDGIVSICPSNVDGDFECNHNHMECYECKKKYWLSKIEKAE